MEHYKTYSEATQQTPAIKVVLGIVFIILAVVLILMNLQVFVWWRKAKHSTLWISFTAVVNIILVSLPQ
jgi:hypothetical protein